MDFKASFVDTVFSDKSNFISNQSFEPKTNTDRKIKLEFMYNKFCCPECGDMMFTEVEWEAAFIDTKGVLNKRAFLIFFCCSNKKRIEIGDDFDWKEWAEFEHFKHKIKSIFWEDFGRENGGY